MALVIHVVSGQLLSYSSLGSCKWIRLLLPLSSSSSSSSSSSLSSLLLSSLLLLLLLLLTFRSEDEDDYEFPVLSTRTSKNVSLQTLCACSVRKTRTHKSSLSSDLKVPIIRTGVEATCSKLTISDLFCLQVCGSIVAFIIRYHLVRFFYDVEQH